jgi:hypothetical protein
MNIRRIFDLKQPDDPRAWSACHSIDFTAERGNAQSLRVSFADPYLAGVSGSPHGVGDVVLESAVSDLAQVRKGAL